MPRAALRLVAPVATAALLAAPGPPAQADPHVDPGVVLVGCSACHQGHGASRSPMLPAPQREVCLACHDTQAALSREVLAGHLAADAAPALLAPALSQPFVHPLSDRAYSQREIGAVTCSSCHSPHRAMVVPPSDAPPGNRKPSPKSPQRFEFELCLDCHGGAGAATQGLVDIGRLVNPNNRSYHPVEAPGAEGAPSVVPDLAGREINCTDCHGNSVRNGPRGPHGSAVPFLLRSAYTTADGAEEAPAAYGLCYDCHERQALLAGDRFPEHREHVVELRTSCSTCHDPHGAEGNRALVRFGERSYPQGVSPSVSTGRLAFVSSGPGSGACYLTCHGHDHGPESYGPELVQEALRTWTVPPAAPGPGESRPSAAAAGRPGRERPRSPPPPELNR